MANSAEQGSKRAAEQEAVRTTIVGGRPPGSGKPVGNVPRGIEVLIKKAAVDPAFRQLLLDKRSEAAKTIGLELRPSEIAMLNGIPRDQLEAIIGRTKVDSKLRPILMGTAAAVMLVALGAGLTGCERKPRGQSLGVRPDKSQSGAQPTTASTPAPADATSTSSVSVPQKAPADTDAVTQPTVPAATEVTKGIRPDRPVMPAAGGVRPDRPPATSGE